MRSTTDPLGEFVAAWTDLVAIVRDEPAFPDSGRAHPDYRSYWQQRRAAIRRVEVAGEHVPTRKDTVRLT